MIYVTHDQVEAMTMADKIVVLRDGRIMQVGRPLDLYNNPANQFVAGFIGSPKMNFLSAKVASGDTSNRTIEVAGQRIVLEKPVTAQQGEPLTFGVRPEHVNPQAQSSLGEASIQLVEHLGGSTVVYTSTPDGQPATVLLDGQRQIRIGETIPFAFDLGKTHLFGADGRRI
jgi:multiple sugar transport system ATP-binding protein